VNLNDVVKRMGDINELTPAERTSIEEEKRKADERKAKTLARKAYMAEYYKKNRKKMLARSREYSLQYYQDHKEEILAKQKMKYDATGVGNG
jgi:predicted glutamine amidotransferase